MTVDETPLVTTPRNTRPLRVAGLFAGIGGLEVGLDRAGHVTSFLCEYDRAADAVLDQWFPKCDRWHDVRDLEVLPVADLVTAGFPCQDLSIAGRGAGISGERSSLVAHIFRLLDESRAPRWLLLENVPFMLQLQQGQGMLYLINQLEQRGYRWAYRVVDTRAFGLPQRRRRVILLASATEDPRGPLLGCDTNGPTLAPMRDDPPCGFYWTEGHRGVGWSTDCLPPIKVGSGLGIPSPPAVWFPATGQISVPDIRDLERLQGFDEDWTEPAVAAEGRNARWRLVGNAVSVPVAEWIGRRLSAPHTYTASHDWPLTEKMAWPNAAWGVDGDRRESEASMWPVSEQLPALDAFLNHDGRSLSPRAAAGLLRRLQRYGAKVPEAFVKDLERLASRHSGTESSVAA